MKEVWKNIDEFEGAYQVSNLGNVRSVERFINTRTYPSQLIKKYEHKVGSNIRGERVHLRMPNKSGQIQRSVAKMVLITFYGNPPKEAKQVIHIDGNPLNNRLDNLKWDVDKSFYMPRNNKARELFDKYAYSFCRMYLFKHKLYDLCLGINDLDDIIQISLMKIYLVIDCFDMENDKTEDDIKRHFYCFCRQKIKWQIDKMKAKEYNTKKPKIYSFSEFNSMVGENYDIENRYGSEDTYSFEKEEEIDLVAFAQKYNLKLEFVKRKYKSI